MNYRSTLANQIKVLDQKFKDQCIVAQDGGLFLLTPEFLSAIENITEDSQWVLDMNQNPILIDNIADFYKRSYNVYYTALSDYGTKFNQLKSQRSVETILDL
jgi:hypothetical protein